MLAEETATDNRTFIIGDQTGQMKMERASWYQDNGQTHQRVIELYNATSQPITFNLIDAVEVRKDLTIQPGERKSFPAKNGMDGGSGAHHLVFPDGHRLDRGASTGSFVVLFKDKNNGDKIGASTCGWVTAPRGKTD